MYRLCIFLQLGLLPTIAATAGCAPSPSASYRVTLQPSASTQVVVELEVRGAPRDGLTLAAHADQQAMGLSHMEVVNQKGVAVHCDVSHRTIVTKGKSVDVPLVSIPGPLSGTVRIRYQVVPVRREGDDHLGYTGTCFGEISSRFALLTGRNLFLVPQGLGEGLRATVRFSLPDGWSAVTPWRRRDDAWVAGERGQAASEALVSGAIGFGRFRERSIKIDRTEYRFAVEEGIPTSEESPLLASLERATRFVHKVFGRGPAASYLTIVAPAADSGDEIAGEGSSYGQGGTLAPVTTGRLRQYADRLISTYLLYAPTRTELRDPREYWIVDAVRSWYSWRAVAEAGLVEGEDVTRKAALAYLASYRASNIDRNVEQMYSEGAPNPFVRSVIAPTLLVYLDRALADSASQVHPLDQIVPRVFRGRVAPSFWSILPGLPKHDWADFREQYARGKRLVPAERLLYLEPTRAQLPTPNSNGRVLTLAFTGDTHGFLENCGCKVNQSGGIARRAKKLAEIRRRDPGMLLLDAGSAFSSLERTGEVDHLARLEQGLYLRTMEAMGYAAASLGTTELALGLEHFHEMTRGISIPFLSANVRSDSGPVVPASTIVNRAGLRIGVVGVFDPPRGDLGERSFEARTADLTFERPATALRREIDALRPQVDLIVVLGRLDPYAIRRVISACPDIDILISPQSDAPTFRVFEGDTLASRSDESGFFKGTLVLYATAHMYGQDIAKVHLNGDGRVTAAEIESFQLGADVGDDPKVRSMLNRFYDEVGQTEAAQASVAPLFSWDSNRSTGRYVGAEHCRTCHEGEFAQWSTTKHAGAFKTLLDAHRHFQPKCVSCHVVGFGTPHGYKLGTPRETLANVQCEVCHGPGGSHVAAPTPANIRRKVPERICLECHNPEHSDHFVYGKKLPMVMHDSDVGRVVNTGGQAANP